MRSFAFVQSEFCSNQILLNRILFCDPLAVATAGDVLHPVCVLQVPVDRLADSGLKRLLWTPMQFALDSTRVHGIAAIMTIAILDECAQGAVRNYRVVGAAIHRVVRRWCLR